MSKKELYPVLSKMPYYKTPVSAIRTKGEIERLLKKYGIEDQLWGTIQGKEAIQFMIDTVAQGAKVKKMVRIDIPKIKARQWSSGSYKIIDVPRAQTLRIVYYALKSILEATKYGIFRLEHIFLSYILTQLPGTTKTVQVKDLLEKHPLMLETGYFEE